MRSGQTVGMNTQYYRYVRSLLPFGCKPISFFLPNPDHLPWLGFFWERGPYQPGAGGPCLAVLTVARMGIALPTAERLAFMKERALLLLLLTALLLLLALALVTATARGYCYCLVLGCFRSGACVLVVAQTLGSHVIHEGSLSPYLQR